MCCCTIPPLYFPWSKACCSVSTQQVPFQLMEKILLGVNPDTDGIQIPAPITLSLLNKNNRKEDILPGKAMELTWQRFHSIWMRWKKAQLVSIFCSGIQCSKVWQILVERIIQNSVWHQTDRWHRFGSIYWLQTQNTTQIFIIHWKTTPQALVLCFLFYTWQFMELSFTINIHILLQTSTITSILQQKMQ